MDPCYVILIVMYQSFVTTPRGERVGYCGGNVPDFFFASSPYGWCFVLFCSCTKIAEITTVHGKTKQTAGSNCRFYRVSVLVGLMVGICRTKTQRPPLFPGRGGGGCGYYAQVCCYQVEAICRRTLQQMIYMKDNFISKLWDLIVSYVSASSLLIILLRQH